MVKTSKFMTKSASFVQRVSCQTTLGIGLALMQELAKLHGGAVRAESIYGKGSRFIVTIPLGYSHLPAAHVGTGVLPEYEVPCLCVPSKTSRMLMGMHLTPPGTRLNGWEWQMSKIIREPLLGWKANFLKKETA